MLLAQMRGLKYPDEYFIRFFFKKGLHTKKSLSFLEFGCSNGNNLMLPYHYRHDVVGVDLNEKRVEDAGFNFDAQKLSGRYEFFSDDMVDFSERKFRSFDVISLPNIINYLSRENFLRFLDNLKRNGYYKSEALLFIRFRSPRDFRNGFGKEIACNSYLVEEDLTSEKGAINTFYDAVEMVDILRDRLGLHDFHTFHIDFENLAQEKTILNSDIVIWGQLS